MKKKGILLAAVILLCTAGLTQAQERELHGTIDVTYLSKYIFRGLDMYGDRGALQPSIDIDLYGTGFGVKVLWSRAVGSGYENWEWFNYTLYYKNSAFEDKTYAMDYKVGWNYYNFPDNPRKGSRADQNADMQDFFASLSWPEILPIDGLTPSYTIIRMWPARSNSYASGWTGTMHAFGLGYDWTVTGLAPEIPEQTFHMSTDLVYNDGILTGDHEWSHMLFGVSTDFEVAENLTFTPGVYYQASMDDSLNPEDETWGGLSMSYKF